MINYESRVPVWFGYQRKYGSMVLPFVYFSRLRSEPADTFLEANPILSDCYGTSTSQDGQKSFDIIFDLSEMTKACSEDRQSWLPYMRYIAAVLDFYGALCAGRNFQAVTAMREKIGLTNTFISTILNV